MMEWASGVKFLLISQRREAVLALLRKEESASAITRRNGVSEPTLYRWRDDFLAGGEAALTNGKGAKSANDCRVAELEQ